MNTTLIETTPDRRITPAAAAKRVPLPTSKNTVLRWIRDGIPTPDGKTVRLPAARLGSRYAIRESDFAKFLETVLVDTISTAESAPALAGAA